MILGTAAYMTPEQARGRTVDKRADIWAFGARAVRDADGTARVRGRGRHRHARGRRPQREPEWTLMPATCRRTLVRFFATMPPEGSRSSGFSDSATCASRWRARSRPRRRTPLTRGSTSRPGTRSFVGVAGLAGLAGALIAAAILSSFDADDSRAGGAHPRVGRCCRRSTHLDSSVFRAGHWRSRRTETSSCIRVSIQTHRQIDWAGRANCNCVRSAASPCATFRRPAVPVNLSSHQMESGSASSREPAS